LVDRAFRALSYVSRSISELLIGITLPLSFSFIKQMSIIHILISITIFAVVPYIGSYIGCLLPMKYKIISKND
jgi:purine-cytosine permease-like protein